MTPTGLSNLYVLVVEDEYLIAMDVSLALEDVGAIVLGPAGSVAKALSTIRAAPRIDVAVLDVNLGGARVYPVADALAERGVPFVFITGYETGSLLPQFAERPLLGKPVSAATIVRTVTRLVPQAA